MRKFGHKLWEYRRSGANQKAGEKKKRAVALVNQESWLVCRFCGVTDGVYALYSVYQSFLKVFFYFERLERRHRGPLYIILSTGRPPNGELYRVFTSCSQLWKDMKTKYWRKIKLPSVLRLSSFRCNNVCYREAYMSKCANLVIYATRRSLQKPPSLISKGIFSFK